MNEVTKKLLEFANRLLESLPKRQLSEGTIKLYQKTAALYYYAPDLALQTTSKRTYYLRKAALSWRATEELRLGVQECDIRRIEYATRILGQFTPEKRRGDGLKAGQKCPIEAAPRRSKRRSLRGLPLNWREQIVDALSDNHREWALLMAVCGCRPSEIQNGVEVIPEAEGITVSILGTKIDRGHGQPFRKIYITGDLARQLAAGGWRIIKSPSANAVSTAIGRAGRRVFGEKRAEAVSAYSFRHQVASDLKFSGIPAIEASAILGHSVEETKRYYGNPLQSRGNLRYRLIDASRAVRISRQQPPSPTGPTLPLSRVGL